MSKYMQPADVAHYVGTACQSKITGFAVTAQEVADFLFGGSLISALQALSGCPGVSQNGWYDSATLAVCHDEDTAGLSGLTLADSLWQIDGLDDDDRFAPEYAARGWTRDEAAEYVWAVARVA